tara:strand:- start:674 stop:1030 length:357 start_codon:yes stop_codon:yes gene_type:complete
MSIIAEVRELDNLNNEIKRLSKSLSALRKRKRELEKIVTEFLERHQEPGVKFEGKAFVKQTKQARTRKKQSEKEHDVYQVLSRYVRDPDKVMGEVLESMKGHECEKQKLEIKPIKKKR